MVPINMYLALLLVPVFVSFSRGIFFGVFDGSVQASKENDLLVKERAALSWLIDQLFRPREDLFVDESGINHPCLGVLCQESVDLSHPFDLDDLTSAWHSNKARTWKVDEVLEWVGDDPERSSLRSTLLREQVDGQKLLSLLVSDANQHDVAMTTENLLWLKERIASLVLFGPPSPKNAMRSLVVSTVCTMIMLLTSCWLLWRQLVVSHRVRLRISHRVYQIRASVDQLRISLNSIRNLIRSSLKNGTFQSKSTSKLLTLSRELWHSMENELAVLEELYNFVERVTDHLEFDIMQRQSNRVWLRHCPLIDRQLEWLTSLAEWLQLRVQYVDCRMPELIAFLSPVNTDSPRSDSASNRASAGQQPPGTTIPTRDEVLVLVDSAQDRTMSITPPPSLPESPVLPVSHQEQDRFSLFCSGATTPSCSEPGSDNDNGVELDTLSNESPKENRPILQLAKENRAEPKSTMTGTKIPKPRRLSAQALTPSFFVMNPPAARSYSEQSNLVTPSQIPLGTRKSITRSTGLSQLRRPLVNPIPELLPRSTDPDTPLHGSPKS